MSTSTTNDSAYNDIYLNYVSMLDIDEVQVEETEILSEPMEDMVMDNKIVSALQNDQLIVLKVENLNNDYDGQVLAVLDDSDNNQIENIILPASDGDNYDCFIPVSNECQFDDTEIPVLDKGSHSFAVGPDEDSCNFGRLEDVARVEKIVETPTEFSTSIYSNNSKRKIKNFGISSEISQTISIDNLERKAPLLSDRVTKRSLGVVSRINGKRIIGKILEIKRPPPPPATDMVVEDIQELNVLQNTKQLVDSEETNIVSPMVKCEEAKSDKNDLTTLFEETPSTTDNSNIDSCTKKKTEIDSHLINATEMDELILKALVGVMDMKYFAKYIVDRTLMIRNVNKFYNSQTKVTTIKSVNYFKGKLQKTFTYESQVEMLTECWQFVPDSSVKERLDNGKNLKNLSNNIDLNVDYNDTQQVKTNPDSGELLDDSTMKNMPHTSTNNQTGADDFLVNLNIIVTEDENGMKKTKIIPKIVENSLVCSVCNKMCPTIFNLRRHMKMCHLNTPPKNYTCDLCKKTFLAASTLKRHRRIHNGDKNFQCNICMKAFNTVGSLKRHITVHLPELRQRHCTICFQRFTDQSSLRKHLILHTGLKSFECNVCFKRFMHLGDLNFHRKIHDPNKRFSCEICGKEFNRHSNLVRHTEIHRDNQGNVHKCDICGSSYNFMSTLTRHIVKNHMKES